MNTNDKAKNKKGLRCRV